MTQQRGSAPDRVPAEEQEHAHLPEGAHPDLWCNQCQRTSPESALSACWCVRYSLVFRLVGLSAGFTHVGVKSPRRTPRPHCRPCWSTVSAITRIFDRHRSVLDAAASEAEGRID